MGNRVVIILAMQNNLRGNVFGLLGRSFLSYIPYYLVGFLALYLTHSTQSEIPFYAKKIADAVSDGGKGVEITDFFLLAIGIIIFRTTSRLAFFYPARVIQKNLRVELLEKLEKTPPARYKQFSPGDLFQVLGSSMDGVRALLGFAFFQVGNIIVAMFVLIPKMRAFNEDLFIALIPMFVCFFLFMLMTNFASHYFHQAEHLQADVQNHIVESYVGKQTIKNYHVEKPFSDLFLNKVDRDLKNSFSAAKYISFSIGLIGLGLGGSLLYGATIIRDLELGATSLVLFSGFLFLFLEPLMYLSWIGVVFVRSQAAWRKIMEVTKSFEIKGEVEKTLERLNVASDDFNIPYWDHKLSFENTFTGADFKSVVFVGETGCGKSELLKKIADLCIKKGKKISFVAQDPYLYNDTIEANLFLGKVPSPEQLLEAKGLLELFGLTMLAKDLDALLSLEVGEHGKRLSGGQAKRVSLVRSILSNVNILIWDDPFSSIDLILERRIMDKLKRDKLLGGKQLILSAHRISTVKQAQYIFYISPEAGIIAEGEVDKCLDEGSSKIYEYFQEQMV